MGTKIGGNLVSNLFQAVPYSKELAEEKEKVVQLESKQGIVEIPIQQIEPNPDQPRKTFSEESIRLLARSLERDGQQQPILVFVRGRNRYFIFEGERRTRAAQLLGWETIQAIVVRDPKDPDALHRKALLANHHRENLNPLDLAEALIKEIKALGALNSDSIPKILNTAVKRLIRNRSIEKLTALVEANQEEQKSVLATLQQAGELTEEECQVLSLLLSLQLNPHSVNTNVIPSLRLYDDLKEAIRKGLGSHQAFALQKLSAKNLAVTEDLALVFRQQVTKEVIEEKLSVAATRARVASELAKHTQPEKPLMSTVTQKAIAVITGVKLNEMEKTELEAFEKALKEKLKEIRANLKN
jgi:ParB family chromosome partitioning protein